MKFHLLWPKRCALVLSGLIAPSDRRPAPRTSRFRPALEELESRLTPSITVDVPNNFKLDASRYGAWVAGTAEPTISESNAGGNSNVLMVLNPATGTFTQAEWAIASATDASGTVTITTISPHQLQSGDQVFVSGVGISGYNGIFQVLPTGLTSTAFEYTDSQTSLLNSGGGAAADSTLITSAIATATAPNGATSSGNQVTITTKDPHQLEAGSTVFISGFTGTAATFNGTYEINTVPSATTFTYTDASVAAIPVAGTNGAVESGNTATITTQSPHGLQAGDWVTIANVGPGGVSGYNGNFQILPTGLTATTFQYTVGGAPNSLPNTGGGAVQLAGGGGTVNGLGVPIIPLTSLPIDPATKLPSFTLDQANGSLAGGHVTIFVSRLGQPPALVGTGGGNGTGLLKATIPPFSPTANNIGPPSDIMEFAYLATGDSPAGSNSTFDLSQVNGLGMPLTLQAQTVTSGPSTVGVSQSTNLSFNRADIASDTGNAYAAFMRNDPQGADYAELLYNSAVPNSSGGNIYVAPPSVRGQSYVIADPNDWLDNQSSTTAANDPLADFWDNTLTKFFQNGNFLSINISSNPAAPNIYSGTCTGGTYSLSNGTNTYTFSNPGTGLAGAKYVFGQSFVSAPAPDQGLLQDNIWEALCRGVALDGVFTSSMTGGQSSTAWNANANGTTGGVQTFQWYTPHTPTHFAGFTSQYDTFAKFLHYSDLTGQDSRTSGNSPIFIGNSAYGFSEDENPDGPYTGGEVPAKFDGTVPDSQTITLTIDPWEAPPVVTGLSVASGPTSGNTPVTINGFNFTNAAEVDFGTAKVLKSQFTVNAGGLSISLFSPPHAAGTVNVTVITDDGSSAITPADQFTYTSSNPATSIIVTAGSGQSAKVNTAFATNLQATVKDQNSQPVPGVTVTFTAPASGPSGIFTGGTNTINEVTNNNGVATASIFTANGTVGGPYTVSATVGGVASPANFSLTNTPNTPPANPIKTIGVFDPSTGNWYLRNSNSAGSPNIGPFAYGAPGWFPIVGDWNGDGVTTIGVVNLQTETWYLRNSNSAGSPSYTPFQYGAPGWIPVAGDWNHTGHAGIGVFDPSTGNWYLRNEVGPGGADAGQFQYGGAGWKPVVGDWTGQGKDTIGVVNPATETWYLRNSNSGGSPNFTPFSYGAPGWTPVAGDWTGIGHSGIGVFNPSQAIWYLRNEVSAGGADAGQFQYGGAGWGAVVGTWVAGTPLTASGPGPGTSTVLTQQQLNSEVHVALQELQMAGAPATILAELSSAQYVVGQLPGNTLGDTYANIHRVVIDADADGWGWFVDSQPQQNNYFANGAARFGTPAVGHMDLLTTVLHEMGHVLGLPDLDLPASSLNVMNDILTPGTRHLADLDAFFSGRGA